MAITSALKTLLPAFTKPRFRRSETKSDSTQSVWTMVQDDRSTDFDEVPEATSDNVWVIGDDEDEDEEGEEGEDVEDIFAQLEDLATIAKQRTRQDVMLYFGAPVSDVAPSYRPEVHLVAASESFEPTLPEADASISGGSSPSASTVSLASFEFSPPPTPATPATPFEFDDAKQFPDIVDSESQDTVLPSTSFLEDVTAELLSRSTIEEAPGVPVCDEPVEAIEETIIVVSSAPSSTSVPHAPDEDTDPAATPAPAASPSTETVKSPSPLTALPISPSIVQEEETTLTRDDFAVSGILGEGSQGTVYRAVHKHTGKEVALKAIAKEHLSVDGRISVQREQENMKKVAGLSGVADLWASFHDKEFFYFVAPVYSGGDLFDVIAYWHDEMGHMPSPIVAYYAAYMLSAMRSVHIRDVLHRDLKPENILIDAFGPAFIADFGLSITGVEHFRLRQERPNDVEQVGTPEYWSRDAYDGKFSRASDIFAIGATVFHMVFGERIFDRETADDLRKAGVEDWHGNLDIWLNGREVEPMIYEILYYTLDTDAQMPISELMNLSLFKHYGIDWAAVKKGSFFLPDAYRLPPKTVSTTTTGGAPDLCQADLKYAPGEDPFPDFYFVADVLKTVSTMAETALSDEPAFSTADLATPAEVPTGVSGDELSLAPEEDPAAVTPSIGTVGPIDSSAQEDAPDALLEATLGACSETEEADAILGGSASVTTITTLIHAASTEPALSTASSTGSLADDEAGDSEDDLSSYVPSSTANLSALNAKSLAEPQTPTAVAEDTAPSAFCEVFSSSGSVAHIFIRPRAILDPTRNKALDVCDVAELCAADTDEYLDEDESDDVDCIDWVPTRDEELCAPRPTKVKLRIGSRLKALARKVKKWL